MDVRVIRTKYIVRLIAGLAATSLLLTMQDGPSVFAAQTGHATPKDSFLSTQVDSIDDLVAEIYHNAAVRARYAGLYHMPTTEVAGYMKDNLEIGHLSRNYTHAVYCVTPHGVIFTAMETLREGDKVFALRNGRPVLRWACGNPFTATLPANTPRTAMAGTVIFTGAKTHRTRAAMTPLTGRHKKLHGLPVQEESSQTLEATNVIVPTEKVLPYVSTLTPAPTVVPVVGGPTNIIVPAVGTFVSHVPLTPFIAALPIAFLGSSGHSSTPTGSPVTTGGTTTGTTGTTSTTGTSGTTAGGITGGLSTGGTTGPGTTSSTTTTGATTGKTSTTPEPAPATTWSLAGLFLAAGAAMGRRRKAVSAIKA